MLSLEFRRLPDYLEGSPGVDLMKDKGDSDVLWGKAGDDLIYANSRNDLAIALDPNAPTTGSRGDWLAGGCKRSLHSICACSIITKIDGMVVCV